MIYHGKYIIPGLVVFLVVITFPIWYGVAGSGRQFDNPIAPGPGELCIEDAPWMRENHMRLLNRWRDEVVRDGKRLREAGRDGKNLVQEYPLKSLTRTCMACHGKAEKDAAGNWKSTSAATYCDECHNYVGVHSFSQSPTYCWDCHIDPVTVGQKPGK